MLNALLGRKIGMTQVFGPNGTVIPVTVIEAGPCFVTQIKTIGRDGYEAVQIGFEQQSTRKAMRPQLGHLGHSLPLLKAQRKRLQAYQQQQRAKVSPVSTEKPIISETMNGQTPRVDPSSGEGETSSASTTNKQTPQDEEPEISLSESESSRVSAEEEPETTRSGTSEPSPKPDKQIQKLLKVQQNRQRRPGPVLGPFKVIREVGLQKGFTADKVQLGTLFDVGLFTDGEAVDIVGTSKGKGFQGVMKRHGFRGGPRTHGQSDRARAPGSIGSGTTPGRVLKGTRMAGRMGNVRRTAKQLRIVQADPARNLLVVKGSVPGANGGLLMIKKHVMR
jgi:large subunit ribosomal protein L3